MNMNCPETCKLKGGIIQCRANAWMVDVWIES